MPLLLHFCQWLYNSSTGTAIRESQYVFPAIETVHALGIVMLVGTISILDMRLLGIVLKREPVSQIAGQLLPWTWFGFSIMLASGFLLFWSEAAKSYFNLAFRLKLLLLLFLGLNSLVFHITVYRRVALWDLAATPPVRAKIAATASLMLWGGVIMAGRMIAYSH